MSRYISFVYISQRHFSFFRLKFMHHVDLVASQDIYIEKIPYSLVLSFFLIFILILIFWTCIDQGAVTFCVSQGLILNS